MKKKRRWRGVFVFFAGHGETVIGQREDAGYLVPVDGRVEDKNTLISWSELTQGAEIIPAKHILFVMDVRMVTGRKVAGKPSCRSKLFYFIGF